MTQRYKKSQEKFKKNFELHENNLPQTIYQNLWDAMKQCLEDTVTI